ncbi:MAG TPA: ferritin-like domain-containing protein [Burkholderiaceae bacterium]|nr:ferritin-like domain-containing protein [Burkholderiaceae bacterium]
MNTLRAQALQLLLTPDPDAKADATRALDSLAHPVGATDQLAEPSGIPGRPALPVLVPHTQLKHRSVHTREGRAALLHALAHIEFNAIDLALDLAWRFAGMPEPFYRDWIRVAREEALHFSLLRNHLQTLGYRYGDFPAHNALWEMAEKTRHDLMARIALVPRTLEARGLDASPPIRAKLLAAGDTDGAAILDVILKDEIEHVAIGNRWYRWLCTREGLDPIATYERMATEYGAPRPRGPFNLEARRAAGFEEVELAWLAAAQNPRNPP